MPRLTKAVPRYRLHKASGQAIVTFDGQDRYLGTHGSDESRELYDRYIAEYLAGGRKAASPVDEVTECWELILRFQKDRKDYYVKDGKPTSEKAAFEFVCNTLLRLYGSLPVDDFGPVKLKAVRQGWIDRGLFRLTINRHVRRLVEVFRFGVEEEMVQPDTWQRLKAVRGLKKGRTPAPESVPVEPVDLVDVEQTIPHLSPVVADMIRLQLFTGARPGEVCRLRPSDLDRSGEVWVYVPGSHKTEHHGRSRKLYLGPDAQAVLLPYLLRPETAHCFSAAESREWFREQAEANRKTPPKYGNGRGRKKDKRDGPGTRAPRTFFDTQTYGQSIKRGCRKAWPVPDALKADPVKAKQWEVDHGWAPNQLRHTRATEVRAKYGLEAAQVILGHATADITQIYAERDEKLAIRVAAESG